MRRLVAFAFALLGCAGGQDQSACEASTCNDAGATFGDGAFGDASACDTTCSDDLTAVVDCHGNVISTCGAGLACGADLKCAEPCAATESLQSSRGCHYALPPPSIYPESIGSCFAALVANAWNAPVDLQVEYGTQSFDVRNIARIPTGNGSVTLDAFPADGKLQPGQLAVIFLADDSAQHPASTGCPQGVQAAVAGVDTGLEQSGLGKTFRITSSGPIVAYDMFPYGGAASYVTSASLLLPTSAWGKSYMTVHAFQNDDTLFPGTVAPYVQVVAAQASTVTLWPTADIAGNDAGIAAGTKGQPWVVSLAAGQYLQLSGELSGTPIQSDAPVSVVGGNNCMRIPIGVAACDSGHQQLLPVNSLGGVYVGARHRDRVQGTHETEPYRILGIVDGTSLQFDPPIASAPPSVAAGQLVTFWTEQDFVVRSQDAAHSFYMSAHMSGANAIAGNSEGDPDFVNVVTPAQYQRSYVFLTDPTYGNTHLVFVRQRNAANAFDDVTLACAGKITGWKPVDAADAFEVAKVDLVANGANVGACGNGVQTASSLTPFGLTVWGWDVYVSYAYPAGTFIQKTNDIHIGPN